MGRQISYVMSADEKRAFFGALEAHGAVFIDKYMQPVSMDAIANREEQQFYIGYPASNYRSEQEVLAEIPGMEAQMESMLHQLEALLGWKAAPKDDRHQINEMDSDVLEVCADWCEEKQEGNRRYCAGRFHIDSDAPQWLQKEYDLIAGRIRRKAAYKHQKAIHWVEYAFPDIAADILENGSYIE